jgi:hypothetical protein
MRQHAVIYLAVSLAELVAKLVTDGTLAIEPVLQLRNPCIRFLASCQVRIMAGSGDAPKDCVLGFIPPGQTDLITLGHHIKVTHVKLLWFNVNPAGGSRGHFPIELPLHSQRPLLLHNAITRGLQDGNFYYSF